MVLWDSHAMKAGVGRRGGGEYFFCTVEDEPRQRMSFIVASLWRGLFTFARLHRLYSRLCRQLKTLHEGATPHWGCSCTQDTHMNTTLIQSCTHKRPRANFCFMTKLKNWGLLVNAFKVIAGRGNSLYRTFMKFLTIRRCFRTCVSKQS